MRVKEVMQKPIATLLPETSAKEALNRMRTLGVTSLPVQDANGVFLGIVQVADIERHIARDEAEGKIAIKDRFSRSAVTATPEMDVARLAEMMRYKGLENIMVLEARHLVGAVSREQSLTAGGRG
ncbi:MAG TPA: CBS domain-containing protein [Candidatus Acidoferrum sp.]|nr:CBS domain-containing protein [Candidatus Methylomirabilis sp.]HWU36978.1 CBS domain-containing protein [Candidatus Acidoferrum sp.]